MAELVSVKDLVKTWTVPRMFRPPLKVNAVNHVSLAINEGETLGLVGESGCGKTTLGRTIMRIYDADSGAVKFDGVDITHLRGNALAKSRRDMQMILQDPYSSLNPAMCTRDIIAEPLLLAEPAISRNEADERIYDVLKKVGMNADAMQKYPYEFSGGQRQRIGIARAIITRPRFILCDEPISALDVSIQAQVVNLLEDLQDEFRLTYLFIAHDLRMALHISDHIAVMKNGTIVECAPSHVIYNNPAHPYTKTLFQAIPKL